MKGLIFTLLLTYGGAAASLVNPFVGLLIYVVFALVRPEALWAWSVPQGGRYSLIVALALLTGWSLKGFGRWEFGRARGVMTCLFVFCFWLVVSASVAPDQKRAWAYVETMSKGLLPCVAAMTLIDSIRKLMGLAWVIVVAQGYLAFEFNLSYLNHQIHPDEWIFASLDNNGIAITMVTSLGLTFFLGLHARNWWLKLLALAMAAMMAHVVLFSMSRGGMLAMAITGVVTFLIIPKRPQDYLVCLIAVLLVLRLAGPQVTKEFSTIAAKEEERDSSAQSRVELTKALITAMLQNPVTGLGPAHWATVAHEYGFVRGKAGHNTWAQVGAETGVVGLVSLLGFYLVGIARLIPLTSEQAPVFDPRLKVLTRAVIAALTGFLVSAAFVSIEGAELPYYIGILGAGVLKLQTLPQTPGVALRPGLSASTRPGPGNTGPLTV